MEEFNFLHQVNSLIELYNQQKKMSGENFNIFSIMSMESDEVFTHSAILAELLNPKGTHELGDSPLKAFYRIVLDKDFDLDIETLHCIKEEYIGKISEDKHEGGRLDIVVKDNDENGIVIENKIYAFEQENQLFRYKNRYPKAKLLYLTLDGKESEQNEVFGNGIYGTISYEIDIRNWIEECLKLAYDKPIVRETLKQYLFLIKKLTHQTYNIEMSKKVIDILKDNFEASAEIYNNFEAVLREKQFLFLEAICNKLEEELSKSGIKNIDVELKNSNNIDVINIKVNSFNSLQLRIKNLNNPLILIGKIDDEIFAILKTLNYKKVDWPTEEWMFWQHKWNGLGRDYKAINNIDSVKVNEIATFLIKTVQVFNNKKE